MTEDAVRDEARGILGFVDSDVARSDKERLTAIAKAHGLSLSAFFRLAADEYIANHEW